MHKRIISLILFVWVTLCMPFAAMAAESNQTAKYLIRNIPNPTCNSIGGEWAIVGLSRCSYPVPEEYFEKYYKNLERVVKECNGILSEDSYTEYSRVIIALSSIEKDGKNVAGYDLSKPLKDYKKVIEQGLNGAIYALLALDAGGYSGPKIQLRDYIIQKELTSGGWSFWEKGSADPDMTAMAVQALLTGNVECVVIDNNPAKALAEKNEGLTVLDTTYVEEDYAGAVSKDNKELLDAMNKILDAKIADGTVQKIIDKYIKAD